jgi:asparagine N-glycosylation enzyme membrane subunit Stt3
MSESNENPFFAAQHLMIDRRVSDFLTWLAGGMISGYFALRMTSASLVDGSYVPVGNDSFYHARRILDAAVGDRGFYQFDHMIHSPEGSWLTWPWAFDYLFAKIVGIVLLLNPELDPMAIAAHIPLVLQAIAIALLVLIAREIRLHPALTLVAIVGIAAFPLNQFTYGVGVLDHHSAEQLFCLLSLWLGLRYFGNSRRTLEPVALGLALGIAPAFHNGLFILQLPVMACIFLLWIRDATPPKRGQLQLAASIICGTLLAVLPSGPFLDMQFTYTTLSWFHLYVSSCTAIAILLMSWQPVSRKGLTIVILSGAGLVAPLIPVILDASSFLAGDLPIKDIAEVQSPLGLMKDSFGIFVVTSNYSWLIIAAPIVMMLFAWRLVRTTNPRTIYLAVSALFGLALFLTQVRFNVYGSWALFLGCAWWIERLSRKREPNFSLVACIAGIVLVCAYYPSLKYQLFKVYPPGLNNEYSTSRSLYPYFAKACSDRPGIALAYSDDGHRVRYHTDCSVIANNFLLTRQHAEKTRELHALLRMSPEELLEAAPHVDYVFARLYNVMRPGVGGFEPTPTALVVESNEPLIVALTMRESLPGNYEVIAELFLSESAEYPFVRVLRINR